MRASDDRPPFHSLSPLLSNPSLNVIDTWTVFYDFHEDKHAGISVSEDMGGLGVCAGAAAGWRNRQR